MNTDDRTDAIGFALNVLHPFASKGANMPSKMCQTCGHAVSWHRLAGGVRRSCGHSGGCDCRQYLEAGVMGGQAPTPKPLKIETNHGMATVSPLITQDSTGAQFMLGLAAKALAQHRLNKLSFDACLSIAKLGSWCWACKGLVEAEVEYNTAANAMGSYYHNSTRRRYDRANDARTQAHIKFLRHLENYEHIADVFKVPGNMLYTEALTLLRELLGEGDEAESDDSATMFTGWRTWNLGKGADGRLKLMSAHTTGHTVWGKDVQALCSGGAPFNGTSRERALAHLMAPAESKVINERDLTIKVDRAVCTCGLYAWTTEELFISQGYRNFAGVQANVVPYGVVQMGADGQSFRCSDMLINKLTVWHGTTLLNGKGHGIQTPSLNSDWVAYLPQQDPLAQMYSALCQDLANQFQVPVDLVNPTNSSSKKIEDLPLVAQFSPMMTVDMLFSPKASSTIEEI